MKWYIRDVEIPNQVCLAPMAGVTNEAFRLLCKEYGAGLVVAEMVSDKAIGYRNEKTLNMIKVNKLEHPISMQVFGSDKESMINAAMYIDKYSDADIIDINMGCPVNKVAKKSEAGASLLKDTAKVYDIVKGIVDNVSKPVTVKIRIGWDSENINAVSNAIAIEKAGASAITVHGRTRAQFYSGKADLDVIKKVKEAVKIPVIGNGDIVDYKTAKHMLDYTHVDAIMIGRGALGNPYIFKEVNEYLDNNVITNRPSNEQILNDIIKQYNNLVRIKGEHLAYLEMRSHIAWYIKGMPGSATIKNQVNQEQDFNKVIGIIKNYLLSEV